MYISALRTWDQRPRRLAKKHRLERQHASDREQHRRIVRDQRGARHAPVLALPIEIEKSLADLGSAAGEIITGGERGARSGSHGRSEAKQD